MNGIEIQYLLGIYFIVVSLSWDGNRISADLVKLVAGLVLLLVAFFGRSLI